MSQFLEEISHSTLLADGAIGSYLFDRTGRLSERNHIYEALNCDHPEQVRAVHLAYLRAGARCLTTNTFGANRAFLETQGEAGRLVDINRQAVRLAKEAIQEFADFSGESKPRYILGSVGPAVMQKAGAEETTYEEQIEQLLDAGVDGLLLETFTAVNDLVRLIDLIRNRFPECPVLVVHLSPRRGPDQQGWKEDPSEFIRLMAERGVDVAGVNCCAPWDARHIMEEVQHLEEVRSGRILLSAMPNGGGFQRIGHRFMTRVNPEFMGRLARTFAELGVRLVGGCCEVHPHHIREMHNFLHGHLVKQKEIEVRSMAEWHPVDARRKQENGPFSRKLKAGNFVVSVEILPSRGTSPVILQKKIEFVAELAASKRADAVDITDGSRGISLMPPGDFISVLRCRLGWQPGADQVELIPHFTCRDLNVMGLQSRLIGFHHQRIHNVLFITGDPPKMSPTYPRSTAVFDLDSVAMLRYTDSCLNAGVDFGGHPLARKGDPRTHFTIGTGFEPEALNLPGELDKLNRKIEAGADYVMTQPAFRWEPLQTLEPFRPRIPVLVGVMILTGLDHATRVGQVPGVVIPDAVFSRFEKYPNPDDQLALGKELAMEQIQKVRSEGWAGLYLMSPASVKPIVEVLAGA